MVRHRPGPQSRLRAGLQDGPSLRGIVLAALLIGLGALAAPGRASAQDAPEFDFYVLSLSWSPSYCEMDRGRDRQQCAGARQFGFIVHGLWPQREQGYPENCAKERRNLPRKLADSMTDLMPNRRLVFQQWDKHGTCSGLEPQAYFDKLRNARALVTIPPAFVGIERDLVTSPEAVEKAFVASNPQLPADGIAVTCRSRMLSEVRICMDKDLRFRSCAEVDRDACRAATVIMPPERAASP